MKLLEKVQKLMKNLLEKVQKLMKNLLEKVQKLYLCRCYETESLR